MNLRVWGLLVAGLLAAFPQAGEPGPAGGEGASRPAGTPPLGLPGLAATYRLEDEPGAAGSTVIRYVLALGPTEARESADYQWLLLHATKRNGAEFRVWLLTAGYPPPTLARARESITRFILQEAALEPEECQDRVSGAAVLPSLGGWVHLFPRPVAPEDRRSPGPFPERTRYVGHAYRLEAVEETHPPAVPPAARVVRLDPDILVGAPSNTRQKDETRRYDDSDYELVRLAREDYREMAAAGMNCLRVDAAQLPWVHELEAFYWGVPVGALPFPELLYRSRYLGPVLFLDEPAVGTRDHVLRPRLARDPAYRRAISPQSAFDAFREYFGHALLEGAPKALRQGLTARPDVELGTMTLAQENLFAWETIESTLGYELAQDPLVPAAAVWEPPGRVGTRRTLPEWDMCYGCQLPTDVPANLAGVLCGFLRGAARLTGKHWGISIYGAVDPADAPWLLTRAYDLGATRFFFWDNYRLACVPYRECLALARHLKMHAGNLPARDLPQLRQAAETAILLPPGYNLGHVHLGRGNLWGLGELNLERRNRQGRPYRVIMGNFFAEIERGLRLGIGFDLLWDLPDHPPRGYREVVRIREDGNVEIERDGHRTVRRGARPCERPPGPPPRLEVVLSSKVGPAPLDLTARARVRETSAPVYYTFGADPAGVYRNAAVLWELYGPDETDYRFLQPPQLRPRVERTPDGYEATTALRLDRPGQYSLRAATVDLAGRSTVVWEPIVVLKPAPPRPRGRRRGLFSISA